ncbi:hypothetical protein OAB59_00695 [Pelagibacteraceae bacterium]|nr:hypothetical protein [Pelagibacteraceae bacterium]
MTNRRKKIILIQFTIFFIASSLLYSTYRDKKPKTEDFTKVEIETDPGVNNFTDIEYSGFDLNGNRYILKAGIADFKNETPEIINMKKVTSNFYLKDNTILKVVSDEGTYNNVTLDMEFRENVKATYLTNTLISGKLNYFSSEGKLLASSNVRGESIERGEFFADNVEYDLKSKILDFSMFNNNQVKVKLKN